MRRIGEEKLQNKSFRWDARGRKKRDIPKKTSLYGILEGTKEKNIAKNLWGDR